MVDLLTLENPLLKNSEITSVVISLRRHGDKLENFYRRYEEAGFSRGNLAWLEGFDAERMGDRRPPMTLRQMDDFGKKRYDHRFFNRPGGFGCYLSHAQAWKWCVESNRPLYVFEDDAAFPYREKTRPFFDSKLSMHYKNDSDVLFLIGYHEIPGRPELRSLPRDLPEHEPVVDVGNIFHGTHLYYITPKAAKKLLEGAFPIEMQVDSYMGLMGKHRGVRIRAYGKPLLNQVNGTIQENCVLCNGKVNGSRFRVGSRHEKDEVCRQTGLCGGEKKHSFKNLFMFTIVAAVAAVTMSRKK